ncbi:MAG: ATP-dependent RecD-like DNA helicase, partial [Clostridia bacterium]
MLLKGTVSDILFANADNGYTVIELLSASGETTICVGNMPLCHIGEVLQLEGHKTVHSKYGEQFVVQSFMAESPTSEIEVVRYLSSGLIKGVGEVTAKNIFGMFGDKTMEVIETSPMELSKVRGISQRKALDISNSVMESKKSQKSIMLLQSYNISIGTSLKIYNIYKENTENIIKTNPYKLVEDVDGIGFLSADKIAQSTGIEADSPFRVRAGIIYCLSSSADMGGNTYLPQDEVISSASRLLNLDLSMRKRLLSDVVGQLILEMDAVQFQVDSVVCLALTKYYNTEKYVAGALVKLNHEPRKLEIDIGSQIEDFERVNHIKFHEGQREAVISACHNGVTVVTGGPGTGKTTIINCISTIYKSHGLKIEFCAPTGRASKRLTQSVGQEAKTIHRLLGFEFVGGKMNFKYNQFNTIPTDVIIVDELSMVDVFLMFSLLRAVETGTRLILVGDKDQLPSVGAGNVLSDIIKSGLIDVKYLTYIYRQSEDSLIISNAHLINERHMPKISNNSSDFFASFQDSPAETLNVIVGLVTSRLPKFTGVSAEEIQVLAPLKSGLTGVDSINRSLQQSVNPPAKGKAEITVGSALFRVGDRVMQTVNDYLMNWTSYAGGVITEGSGVFNGDIGFIRKIETYTQTVEIEFDDNKVSAYQLVDMYNLQLSYACTIHKSQGSEFNVVVVPIMAGPPTIINKNL